MCSAYNEGVRKAKFPYLCFMHEDITFLSQNWGKECINEFVDPEVWMLGVVGAKYFDAMFAYWYPSPYLAGHNMEKNGELSSYNNSNKSEDVVVVDGMWICMKRNAFDEGLMWDEKTFLKFDMYDMDMSMQVIRKGKKIRTASKIDLYHASEGNFSGTFYEEVIKFHNKWDSVLPVATFPITLEIKQKVHRYILNRLNKYEKDTRDRKRKLEKWPLSILYKIYKNTFR